MGLRPTPQVGLKASSPLASQAPPPTGRSLAEARSLPPILISIMSKDIVLIVMRMRDIHPGNEALYTLMGPLGRGLPTSRAFTHQRPIHPHYTTKVPIHHKSAVKVPLPYKGGVKVCKGVYKQNNCVYYTHSKQVLYV